MRTLASGTSQLAAGSEQLTVGAAQLASGLVTLDAGSGELALKLHQARDEMPHCADNAAASISTRVPILETRDSLGLFGPGLSPIFVSLGLFKSSTVIVVLLRLLGRRTVDSGSGVLSGVLASYIPAAMISLSQATAMFVV
ncbi:hypothetical protein N7326_00890 [Corynebacterium sp. ES2794-CONJ1]|uniref:hypothetical protein n=1 Tax=Corynebacterium sp. ES2775-CONJ TaxID=2974029 RepID=UPI00216811FD|nr:hypothetical protein [Corynebacterium sp. ES2775-CONJ]MCS4489243.1 hypothetical protein [Corynebacterium sp. ES2775-CONJ]MCS4531063.1 hypothetical protein [Corynebacterium sp. ES2730-CONJ]MCU9518430.1 hypothetical protein [Corynebacterium sp. ES2794-CONJ1]